MLRVLDISLLPHSSDHFLGYSVDQPRPGDFFNGYTFQIVGWVLGIKEAVFVEIVTNDGELVQKIPVDSFRPDVAQIYLDLHENFKVGFRAKLSLFKLPKKSRVLLKISFNDGEKITIGSISFERESLCSQYEPKLNPLIVSAIGRSGTTYLMQLLSYHPQMVMGEDYPYEIRPALYWMQMLTALAQPSAPLVISHTSNKGSEIEWLGRNALFDDSVASASVIKQFERFYPECFASFCQQNIDKYYHQVYVHSNKFKKELSEEENFSKLSSAYFVEKNPLISTPLLEIYPRGREVLLVRDYRDIFCSVLAFNDKRGNSDFGFQYHENKSSYAYALAENFLSYVSRWEQHADQRYVVHYEKLITEPIETLSAILRFLDVDSSDSLVEDIICRAQKSTCHLDSHRTASSPIDSIGRWRQDLDTETQQLVNNAFSKILQEFGYSAV